LSRFAQAIMHRGCMRRIVGEMIDRAAARLG